MRSSIACFNPRPSVRGDTVRRSAPAETMRFNPRPSVRGDMFLDEKANSLAKFQSTPLREGRQQMFPDFLRKFRNTFTNFVVLDEICGCEVPGFEGESTKMWCEGSGNFMTAWGSHVRLCGGDTAYMILLFLLLRFAIFSKISPFSPHQRGICVCLLFGIGHICAIAVRSSLRNAFESACISYGFKSLTYDGSMD